MQQDLKNFVAQCLRTVTMALVPVVLTAFVTIPWTLGGSPGHHAARSAQGDGHMT